MNVNIATSIYHPNIPLKGVFVIIHGMSEHRKRYDDFAKFLSENGYGVFTYDQIGHGETASSNEELGYFGKKDGFKSLVYYAYHMCLEAKKEFKDVPLYVFGHSMGSIVARSLLKNHPDVMQALILSGPPNYQLLVRPGRAFSKILCFIQGDKKRNKYLKGMIFGNFGKQFGSEVENSWLSVNKENVLNYNNDELCGFNFTKKGYYDMLTGLLDIHDTNHYLVNNTSKPILIVAGKDDPVIGKDSGIKTTIKDLEKPGYKNIELKLYENARHELLFENIHEEVYKDILEWVKKFDFN